ncbi:MAG: hypothetical protein U0T83_06185 [Bacteriovoracaceae bacterium]
MNFDDLTWLVDETLKLAAEGVIPEVGAEYSASTPDPVLAPEPPLNRQEAGIIYYLEAKTASRVLKCLPIKDIEAEFKKLHSNQVFESSLFSLIQNNKIESIDNLSFFPTENYEEAELLFKTFAEERFPLKNMGEIENAWWLEFDDTTFKLFFRSYGLLDEQKSIYLGPLVKESNFEVMKIFQSLISDLQSILKFKEFQLTGSKLILNFESNSFVNFRDIFLEGREPTGFECIETIKFLKTIALSRRFWLQLSKMLK